MSNLIKRLTFLHRTPDGFEAEEVVKPKKSKNKRPKWAKPAEKARRDTITFQRTYWDEMGRLHDKSNSKRPFGSAVERGRNTAKALRKAFRAVR